jgi:hypothetical protein
MVVESPTVAFRLSSLENWSISNKRKPQTKNRSSQFFVGSKRKKIDKGIKRPIKIPV